MIRAVSEGVPGPAYLLTRTPNKSLYHKRYLKTISTPSAQHALWLLTGESWPPVLGPEWLFSYETERNEALELLLKNDHEGRRMEDDGLAWPGLVWCGVGVIRGAWRKVASWRRCCTSHAPIRVVSWSFQHRHGTAQQKRWEYRRGGLEYIYDENVRTCGDTHHEPSNR